MDKHKVQVSTDLWQISIYIGQCTEDKRRIHGVHTKMASVCRDIGNLKKILYNIWWLAKNCTVNINELPVSIEDNIQSRLLVVLYKWKMQMPAKTLAFLTYNIKLNCENVHCLLYICYPYLWWKCWRIKKGCIGSTIS